MTGSGFYLEPAQTLLMFRHYQCPDTVNVQALTVRDKGLIVCNEMKSYRDTDSANESLASTCERIDHAFVNSDIEFGGKRGRLASTVSPIEPSAKTLRELRTKAAYGGICLFLFAWSAISGSSQSAASVPSASGKLDRADLMGLLDCATRPDQILAVRPEFYDADGLRVRYMYPVLPGREANMLNTFAGRNWVVLALYHRDAHSAALFEVGFEGPRSKRRFTLLDGANLEKDKGSWVAKNILNGAGSTWPEIVKHVERVSAMPLVTVPRAAVTRTNASCEFPKRGLTFVAVSPSGDRSDWKFKDGVTEGIRFQTQDGPFKNTDLKSIPYVQVYMNSYGPE